MFPITGWPIRAASLFMSDMNCLVAATYNEDPISSKFGFYNGRFRVGKVLLSSFCALFVGEQLTPPAAIPAWPARTILLRLPSGTSLLSFPTTPPQFEILGTIGVPRGASPAISSASEDGASFVTKTMLFLGITGITLAARRRLAGCAWL